MAVDLVASPFWRFPTLRPLWEEDEEMQITGGFPGGLSLSEDDNHVYVQVSLPGVNPDDVEITFDKGVLWIKGEVKEEEEKKKYYRKAVRSFSYRVAVPGELDHNVEPEATSKHGVMTIAFAKSPKAQPKKISVKKS